MRIIRKVIITFILIVVIVIAWQILTQKRKPTLSPTTGTIDTLIPTIQTSKESTIAVPEEVPIQKPETTGEITKTPDKPKEPPYDSIIAIHERQSVKETEVPKETIKLLPQSTQLLQDSVITIPSLTIGETEFIKKPDSELPDIGTYLPDTSAFLDSNRAEISDTAAYPIISDAGLWLIKPYQIRERIDYSSNQVYSELWQDSIFLGTEKVIPITDYFMLSAKKNLLTRSKEDGLRRTSDGEQAFDRMGLIPDVELPRIPLFGEGSRINVSGSDKITFGGRQTFTSGFTQTATSTRLLPELKMEQALRVNLEGTIGERTKVLIDHDSERDQLGKNKIKLTYTGTEDDILQNLEFGDTRLVIPGTGYTGDLPSRKGLFGISGKAKLGGLDLYAIASREESQGETKEFRGQTTVVSDTIYDTDFLRRTFFWIGETALGRISDLKVYINDGVITNPNAEPTIASVFWQYPESIPRYYLYDRDSGRYALKVRGQDYIFHEESNIIEFTKNSPLPTNWRVGVSYVTGSDTVGGRRFIYHDTIPMLILKLILPQRSDTLSQCWNYELKNVYSLGARDIKIENIKILRYEQGIDPSNFPEIETDGPKSGQTFLRMLGLDPDNNGTIEWPEFDASRGYVIFPRMFPFSDESLSVPNQIIYRRDNLTLSEGRKYLIVTSYMTSKGSFALGQFDIEEGSEKVYVNGQLLTTDDYDINYLTGELRFIKPLPQNADVKVTYEYRPLFSLAQKSLIGTRGEWKFSENGRIGTSLFYRQEAMPETKATLGAEPFQRLIAETDMSYNYQPEFINTFLEKIPLLRTSSPSSISFASEGAISLPNPNTRGLTYLDDFEKTTLSQDVSMRGLLWQFASVPAVKDTNTFASERLFWFNPTTRLRKDSIFGTGIGEEGKETVDYLRVYYTPDDSSSWSGLMTCVSQTGWNLSDIENMEVVFRSNQSFGQNGKMHFSIATRIDEDAPRQTKYGTVVGYNNFQDKEDRNNNGILDEGLGEDSGLDTIIGVDSDNVAGDNGNDDYHATNNPVGTEGNRRLDDEDLDQNGYSRNNDYFEFSISLSDSVFFTSLSNRWRLLRIPLMDSIVMRDPLKFRTEGTPKWEDIRIVRIWFSDFTSPETIDMYSLAFVGSRWRNPQVIKPDTITNPTQPVDSSEKVLVASISQKTDPNYVPPFEPRKDQTGQLEYEASLSMSYNEIKPGHIAIVTKNNLEREDYRDYRTIKLYVHNDLNNPNFLFRFGGDSLNFYEYQASINNGALVPGRDNYWYEFEIILDTAVSVKAQKDTFKNLVIGNYRAYGSPSLADIRYQALAIENPGQMRISGSVWFGDIRLINPRAEAGYGFQTSATFTLSDLASASLSFIYSDPNFRRFSEGRGVKTGGFGTNMGYTVRASLDRFFPVSWGLSIPVSMRRTIGRTLPKYSSKFSDLRIAGTDSSAQKEKSANNEEQWALNNLSKAKSQNTILNYTLEAMTLSIGQRNTNSFAALDSNAAFSRFGSIDYQIAPDIKITLFDNEISLFPNNIRAGLDLSDSRAKPYTRRLVNDSFQLIRTDTTRTADVGLDIEYSPMDDLEFSYSNGSSRDLFVPKNAPGIAEIGGVNFGIETDNEENFGANYEIELFDIIKPRISYDGQYTEDHPKTRGEYDTIRNFNNSSNIDVSGEFNLPGLFEKVGDIAEGGSVSKAMNSLASIFQSIDLSYSKDWAANFLSAGRRPSRLFRLGFGSYDTSKISAQQVTRELGDDFSASTGVNIKDISMSIKYGVTNDRNIYTYDINGNRAIIWPEISLGLSRIERLLFGLATSSNISTSYRLQQAQSGTIIDDSFDIVGRRQGISKNFSPLVSWQTTWKPKLSTNISTSYSQSSEDVFLTNGIATATTTQSGANASISYTFSAPKGIPIPFLRSVRLPSDLGLTWNLRYSKTISINRDYLGQESPSRDDRNLGTDIAASYRLSNSVESGLSTGYSVYSDIQRGRTTNNVDLNFWVLFKF
jgi:hypothetical protein